MIALNNHAKLLKCFASSPRYIAAATGARDITRLESQTRREQGLETNMSRAVSGMIFTTTITY